MAGKPYPDRINKDMQEFTITFASTATTGTTAISLVNLDNAFIVPAGVSTVDAPISDESLIRLDLTTSTLVTATREGVSGSTPTVAGTVVEYK